ncbi:unnamed protein product [Psylliodes chrysocephalus]|uniref:Lipoprotein n=1 Tax=Psylliodes chrysocephalus TaxID=3402493 RepID=A0A9P0GB57_9CUCU|nr:unnamed protein product [Psylliodes chrysocephala]
MFRLIIIIVLGALCSCVVTKPSIKYTMHYSNYRTLGANWSTTTKYRDESITYKVVNWRNYTNSLEDFIKEYPTVTIQTDGMAKSSSTIGDVGSGKFGKVTFETIHFTNEIRRVHIVDASQNSFWWDVGVFIGFNFQAKNENLYITPYINAWIYSGGAVWRELDIGLRATDVTFMPINDDVK